jgi:hypothetical protein
VHAIASRHEVYPVQVSQWKKEAAERLPEVFARKADHDAESAKERERELFEEIGRGGTGSGRCSLPGKPSRAPIFAMARR